VVSFPMDDVEVIRKEDKRSSTHDICCVHDVMYRFFSISFLSFLLLKYAPQKVYMVGDKTLWALL
jgi:hypothetical protein